VTTKRTFPAGAPCVWGKTLNSSTCTATSGLIVTAPEEQTPSEMATAAAAKIPSDSFRMGSPFVREGVSIVRCLYIDNTTRNPKVKSLADLTEQDRIAVPGVKVKLPKRTIGRYKAADFPFKYVPEPF